MAFTGSFTPERIPGPHVAPEEDLDLLAERAAEEQMREEEEEGERLAEAAQHEPTLVETAKEGALVDPRVASIEGILNEKLEVKAYFDQQDPKAVAAQETFVASGRSLAHELAARKGPLEPLAVYEAILEWLHALPEFNRFYARQVAHIKATKICDAASE